MSDVETFGIGEETDSGGAEGVYANSEKAEDRGTHLHAHRGDSADEIDPRKLVRDPTLSEIRWYYRRTFARTLVDKPIDDAFKHGFGEIEAPDSDVDVEELLDRPSWEGEGSGYIGAYQLAEKKARRDGFALVFFGTRERNSPGPHVSPISEDIDVDEVSHLKVLTVDDLAHGSPNDQIEEGTGLDSSEYEVRETGMVVNTDLESPDYRTPIGYVLDNEKHQFVHADRVQHLTWNPEVDGDYRTDSIRRWDEVNDVLGQYEGDSVLIPSYDLMKGLAKGNWSIMQALYRNAAHVYSVKVPNNASEEEFDAADRAMSNVNAKSGFTWPSEDYEFNQHSSGNQMEPRDHFDVIFDQVCATHEMTRSVLFGTQTGTVSGSETDIKNYFNKVERFRTGRATEKIGEYLTRVKRMEDTRTNGNYEFEVDIDWGPLFKVDEDTRINMLQNESNALTTLIGSYALTPDEAREVLDEEFTDIELDSLTEEQMDVLDRINLTNAGQGPSAIESEREYTEGGPENPNAAASQGGREGGMEQGQTTGSENPASADSAAQSATADSDETVVDRLERLSTLYDDGLLSEEEFEATKQTILDE